MGLEATKDTVWFYVVLADGANWTFMDKVFHKAVHSAVEYIFMKLHLLEYTCGMYLYRHSIGNSSNNWNSKIPVVSVNQLLI